MLSESLTRRVYDSLYMFLQLVRLRGISVKPIFEEFLAVGRMFRTNVRSSVAGCNTT